MSNTVHIINIPYLHGLELITNTSQVAGYPTFLPDGSVKICRQNTEEAAA